MSPNSHGYRSVLPGSFCPSGSSNHCILATVSKGEQKLLSKLITEFRLCFIYLLNYLPTRLNVCQNQVQTLANASVTTKILAPWEVKIYLRSNDDSTFLLLKQNNTWSETCHVPTFWFYIIRKKKCFRCFWYIPELSGLSSYAFTQFEQFQKNSMSRSCYFWKLHTCHFQSIHVAVYCHLQCKLINIEVIQKTTIIA